MIAAESISKSYHGHRVVSDVSFAVDRGETLVLLGTSGSGKTTILKMINRLVEPDAGSIRMGGEEITRAKPETLRRKIGYVIQQSGLFPHYTVSQNIGLVPSLLNWSAPRIERRTRELLEVVGLSDLLLDRYPHELSGGQQQRVGIARALAADPPVILMDEPFGALDPITKQQMSREFASLGVLREKTVVLVTHDVLEAFTLGDRICLLNEGEIQQWGTPKELLFSPKNDFVRSFFAAQRMRLAMEIITLADILPSSAEYSEEDHDRPIVSRSASVFEALNTLEEAKVTHVLVGQSPKDSVLLSQRDLMVNFVEWQSKLN